MWESDREGHHRLAAHAVAIGTHDRGSVARVNRIRVQYGLPPMTEAEAKEWENRRAKPRETS